MTLLFTWESQLWDVHSSLHSYFHNHDYYYYNHTTGKNFEGKGPDREGGREMLSMLLECRTKENAEKVKCRQSTRGFGAGPSRPTSQRSCTAEDDQAKLIQKKYHYRIACRTVSSHQSSSHKWHQQQPKEEEYIVGRQSGELDYIYNWDSKYES